MSKKQKEIRGEKKKMQQKTFDFVFIFFIK